ncbi:PKD domain-containing protein [bacterium SCSIO 12741]|nr:PKD domain-containing protein [bacterium SCSIO 12741]
MQKMKIRVSGILLLTVLALLGCKQKPPLVTFEYETRNGGIVVFTNTTAGIVDELEWDFDDGTENSKETNPIHRYVKAGKYEVILTAQNAGGASTHSEIIEVVAGTQENLDDHPQFSDAHGYYYARNTLEYLPSIPTVYTNIRGSALAALYDSSNFLVEVGIVSCNAKELELNPDNSYSYHSEDSSWYFYNGEVLWRSDGGNGYPAVVENLPGSFPELQGIVPSGDLTLGKDSTYILKTAKQINPADSVLWLIQDLNGNNIASKTTPGGVAGVVFDWEDGIMNIRQRGTYITKVVAYSYIRNVYNFKVVYFTKESFTEGEFKVI